MLDLLEFCTHIEQFTRGATRAAFLDNVMMQFATMRGIEVLGEASKRLLDTVPDATSRFAAIPLKTMYATRNLLIHGYDDVELEQIWEIVERDIPPDREAVEAVLASWPSDLT